MRVGRNLPNGEGLLAGGPGRQQRASAVARRPARHRHRSARGDARRAEARAAQGRTAPCACWRRATTAAATPCAGAPTARAWRSCCARWTTRTAGSRPWSRPAGRWRVAHRLSDPGWINWNFNDFGWLPDSRTLWYLSAKRVAGRTCTLKPASGTAKSLTSGKWEASAVQWSPDGSTAWFLCNRAAARRLRSLRGAARWRRRCASSARSTASRTSSPSPDGSQLLLRWSSAYMPPQLAVLPAAGGEARKLTDTRSGAVPSRASGSSRSTCRCRPRTAPASSGQSCTRPATMEPGRKYPVVMFVHGAGYLQNVSSKLPELLPRADVPQPAGASSGYIVLDMDYRGSEGYGRDWRNAIYRRMGHARAGGLPRRRELDGRQQAGRPRARGHLRRQLRRLHGLHGACSRRRRCSRPAPRLRPVTDWTTYNHEYTSNILNTPDVDPEAYKRSPRRSSSRTGCRATC